MNILNFISFLCFTSITICCLLSSIFSSAWLWEAKKINDVNMCNSKGTPKDFILCPLKDDILEESRQKILKKKYNESKLKMNDLLNNYYIDGYNPIKFIYCNQNLTKCTITMNQNDTKYELIEDIVYIGSYNDKEKINVYVYFPQNLTIDILSAQNITSLDDFILAIKSTVKDFRPQKYKNMSLEDRKKVALQAVFVDFPYDGLVTTFKETIYRKLDPKITAAYLNIIKNKINKKESLTTFEFFSYFAILSITDNSIYKVLIADN